MSKEKDMCRCCGLSKARGYYRTESGEFFFTFNWEGGGWNQEYAKTQTQAIRKAESKVRASPSNGVRSLKVDRQTINKCTKAEMDAWYRNGWLATI